jgi:lipid-A-disaccharide synthase-like uncharacterized protein
MPITVNEILKYVNEALILSGTSITIILSILQLIQLIFANPWKEQLVPKLLYFSTILGSTFYLTYWIIFLFETEIIYKVFAYFFYNLCAIINIAFLIRLTQNANGPRVPLDSYIVRVIIGAIFGLIIYYTPFVYSSQFSSFSFIIIYCIYFVLVIVYGYRAHKKMLSISHPQQAYLITKITRICISYTVLFTHLTIVDIIFIFDSSIFSKGSIAYWVNFLVANSLLFFAAFITILGYWRELAIIKEKCCCCCTETVKNIQSRRSYNTIPNYDSSRRLSVSYNQSTNQ